MGEPNFESYFLTQVATPHNGYLEPALSCCQVILLFIFCG